MWHLSAKHRSSFCLSIFGTMNTLFNFNKVQHLAAVCHRPADDCLSATCPRLAWDLRRLPDVRSAAREPLGKPGRSFARVTAEFRRDVLFLNFFSF